MKLQDEIVRTISLNKQTISCKNKQTNNFWEDSPSSCGSDKKLASQHQSLRVAASSSRMWSDPKTCCWGPAFSSPSRVSSLQVFSLPPLPSIFPLDCTDHHADPSTVCANVYRRWYADLRMIYSLWKKEGGRNSRRWLAEENHEEQPFPSWRKLTSSRGLS